MSDPDENESILEELTDEQRKAAEAELSKRFEAKLEEGETAIKSVNSLTSDADVARVLQLKSKGSEAKVLSIEEYEELKRGGSARKDTKDDDDPLAGRSLDDLDRKEFMDLIVNKMSDAMGKAFEDNTKDIKEQLKSQQEERELEAARKVSDEIKKVEAKYKDFNDHRQSMHDIHQENPNLSVEELYHIARARAGVKGEPEVQSERPTHSSARPTKKRKEPVAKGRRGFADLVDSAVGKVNFDDMDS